MKKRKKNKLSPIGFFALAEAKNKIVKSTIRPIDDLPTQPQFYLKNNRIVVSLSVFYSYVTLALKRPKKIKYFVLLDCTKKQVRYTKMPTISLENYHSYTFDLDLREGRE